jgi:hypothetical protein
MQEDIRKTWERPTSSRTYLKEELRMRSRKKEIFEDLYCAGSV